MEHKNDNTKSLLSKWRNRKAKVVDNVSGIPQIPEGITIPLSREQKRLWFLQQINPKNPFYNYSEVYRLEGHLNVEAFKKSIRLIENKYEILKSNYVVEAGSPVVKINTNLESDFLYFDVSHHKNEAVEADKIIQKHSRTVYNLSEGSLMKSAIIKVADNIHLFLIVMHHIITDKWSMRVFRKDLADFYTSLNSGNTPNVEKPKIQYASYAYWQQNKKIDNSHLEYWKKKLSGEIPTLKLPLDNPKKPQPSYRGTFHKQTYTKETSSSFFELCKKLEATPYVVMLSAYYILLNKYSKQTDIFIGTPITKRDKDSLENLIGFFNDTLVLRNQVEGNFSFETLVKKVKQTTLEAFANKEISFDTLVRELNPKRSLNVHPFFQVMFLYHQVPETPVLDPSIQISYEPYDMGVAKFDLTLYISEDNGDLMSLMEYETDLFNASTIERMHHHFEIILQQVISNSEITIAEVTTASNKEKEFFDFLENPKEDITPLSTGIHEIIENQAKDNPEKVAIAFKDEKITYGQLNTEANNVASYLIKNGIQKSDVVGLCVERSSKMITGLLGILKAGATYLPLDPSYPKERIQYILAHSKAKVLLIGEEIENKFNNSNTTILNIEVPQSFSSISLELPKVTKEDLAYIIYTSGSTGKPKGAPISHGNIINSTLARNNFYEEKPTSFLLMSSIAFDSSKAGIFWSLCSGATLVISKNKLEQDLEKLTSVIKNHMVSHTLMLPSLYQSIINFGDLNKLSSLTNIIVAGEACNKALVETHFNKLPQVNLYNEYGPTEGTVWCLAHIIDKEDAKRNSIPIGKSVANTEIYVLDPNLKKVPFGTEGELYIGGKSLAQGYYNDPEKTVASFVENPFKKGQKIYKTGDLVKFNSDKTLQFIGRKDQQVKVRGYRIELDEIEQQIYLDKNIKLAAVNIEDNSLNMDLDTLQKMNKNELSKILNKNIEKQDIEGLLKSVEDLNENEIEVLLNNL